MSIDSTVIASPDHITASWLTAVLRDSGALADGSVKSFSTQVSEGVNSTIVRISLDYEYESQGKLPKKLLLKLCQSEDFGPSEVHYYSRDYLGLHNPPIPACYDTAYSDDPRRYHILMDDYSDTHRNSHGRAPTKAYGIAVAEALASLHAHLWGETRLRSTGIALPDSRDIEKYVAAVADGVAPMLESAGCEIPGHWKEVIGQVFDCHPALMVRRLEDSESLTVIQGDANPGNILSPIDGDTPIYLIDRQPFDESLTVWLGVSDISYILVSCWESDLRRKIDTPVLRHYHDCLVKRGISGYSWDNLMQDYRLAAVQGIYHAASRCVEKDEREEMKWLWMMQLDRAMAAYFDLRCSQLWSAKS